MPKKKTVMVVEDNEINRAMLTAILAPDYHVLEAENGRDALDVLARCREKGRDEVSLILLDIVMPVMDGHEFLSVLRKDPEYSSLPVIVTTQSDSERDEVNALALGATDFVTKPYRPQIILHRMRSFISLRENAALANQFRFDRLTGLYTQGYFLQRAREALDRDPDGEYDVVYSDIEHFKLYNDLFGTAFGDKLLLAVARGYRQQHGAENISARFHADQFVCLTPRQERYGECFSAITAALERAAQGRPVVIKWGIYQIEDKSLPVDQMCDRAQLAVRQIKGQYGRQFNIYDDALRSHLLREQAITDCMERALAEDQFHVYYQPKYRLKDNRLCGAEALVRWIHPEWGFQPPDEFIPLFEQNGFVTQLDRFVWERTCQHLHEWDELGLPPFPVSVNVSRADIYNADLESILTGLVKQYQLSPNRLHLEITESAYTENTDQIVKVVTRLRELGFVIELDDFGSGYSSLSMITELPMDIIKLDMRLIQHQTARPENLGVLYFIMDLVRWMDVLAVAEGVETIEQIQRLRDAGCDIVQGYYLSKPVPVEEFQALALRQLSGGEPAIPELRDSHRSVLLVADEDPEVRAMARDVFSAQFQVVEAGDKEAALNGIASHRDDLAAAILSFTLPGPADLSLPRFLRGRAVPIIATADANDPWEETALEQGAGDFLRRPFTPGSLRLRVLGAISKAETVVREHLLRQEAYQDALTGLLNRRGLAKAMAALDRETSPFAVYILDLDHLKYINDTKGHLEGDRHIQRFARHLKSCTRQTDILGRYGGDEFVVVLPGVSTPEQALSRGQALCGLTAEGEVEGRVPCTAGAAVCQPTENMEDMIRRADNALYKAKRTNRGSCSI